MCRQTSGTDLITGEVVVVVDFEQILQLVIHRECLFIEKSLETSSQPWCYYLTKDLLLAPQPPLD